MDKVGLDEVDVDNLIPPGLGKLDAGFWFSVHEAQLSVNVRLLLGICQLVPMVIVSISCSSAS